MNQGPPYAFEGLLLAAPEQTPVISCAHIFPTRLASSEFKFSNPEASLQGEATKPRLRLTNAPLAGP